MSKLLVRPSLHTTWSLPVRPVIRSMSLGLAHLDHAARGDLVGFALGHGLGPATSAAASPSTHALSSGPVTTAPATARINLRHHAQAIFDDLLPPKLDSVALARIFGRVLGAREGEFETVHFADFTVAFLDDTSGSTHNLRDIRIYADPARDQSDAARRATEIEALFAFLGESHTSLSDYRYDLPRPEMLRHAA